MSESRLDLELVVEEEPRARTSATPNDMTNILEAMMSKLSDIATTQPPNFHSGQRDVH